MSVITINSSDIIPDIESHFKILAGPGAGKTYWLTNHIKNVLHNSEKLYKTKKIACITYTNTATETILKRLGTSIDRVEVQTIHSFLYKNIVKPYLSTIAQEYNFNVKEMNGHDDIVLSNYSFMNEWKIRTGQRRIRDDNAVIQAFKNLKWKFDNGELKVKTDYPFRADGYIIKNDSYIEYKKMTWEKGLLHHDDVLFFSYEILKSKPFLGKLLVSKFPYIFIDEFQDSNPIQVKIFKILGNEESTIGIIGDISQSIYKFQGADPSQFRLFDLRNIKEYCLLENHRSCNEIIDVLNMVRCDISQIKVRNISNEKPTIFIGNMVNALQKAKEICSGELVHTLSRNNITSNAMKAEINGSCLNNKLLEEIIIIDKPSSSNKYRSKLISSCIKTVSYAREKKFGDAIKELEKFFSFKDKEKGKRKSLCYISFLLKHYEVYKDLNLICFTQFVRDNLVNDLSNFREGTAKSFYETHTFEELSLCVSIPEDKSLHKTIHKSKGDEFDNVLLVLREENDLEFLLNPNLSDDEEHRINYVAISRAKNNLFISIPAVSSDKRNILEQYFNIEEL
ncbi:UvrD-helicase domain-containing protein [Aliarcobacter lanthieri]|uniref:UvrD-helicase domain-containing protein n=1 Tax=Aliarcobacter lanthieri TaxID=1355374 RepID=UPI00047ACB6E|nr:ATP-dependent helicase [Aliarcobacter lanthieri]QKF58417.1 putative helicase, UvrD/REP family [Aliarcobacter lanthieri]